MKTGITHDRGQIAQLNGNEELLQQIEDGVWISTYLLHSVAKLLNGSHYFHTISFLMFFSVVYSVFFPEYYKHYESLVYITMGLIASFKRRLNTIEIKRVNGTTFNINVMDFSNNACLWQHITRTLLSSCTLASP